ncbi:MAG: hypothetical protein KF891_22350 [Rhizobacter sp.]|nr:hypothetical protein [Rhizobacter sp.]
MDMTGIATALAAGSIGALLGGAMAWRVLGARATARYARLVAAAREQVATSTQNLRTTNARLQAELEKEKASARQRQLAFAAEQRASVTRLEGQLRFAYAEIDRLNGSSGGDAHARPGDGATDAHGFALTRPYER